MNVFSGLLLILAFSPLLPGCAHQQKDKTNKENINNYIETAYNIIDFTKKKKPSAAVTNEAQKLLSTSVPIIMDYGERHPDCKKYLELVLSFKDLMPTLKLDEIKSQFHEGEVLPAASDKCISAKELLVRPATVIILANNYYDDAGRELISSGMHEALEEIKKLD